MSSCESAIRCWEAEDSRTLKGCHSFTAGHEFDPLWGRTVAARRGPGVIRRADECDPFRVENGVLP
jgi:hypothetical protein